MWKHDLGWELLPLGQAPLPLPGPICTTHPAPTPGLPHISLSDYAPLFSEQVGSHKILAYPEMSLLSSSGKLRLADIQQWTTFKG